MANMTMKPRHCLLMLRKGFFLALTSQKTAIASRLNLTRQEKSRRIVHKHSQVRHICHLFSLSLLAAGLLGSVSVQANTHLDRAIQYCAQGLQVETVNTPVSLKVLQRYLHKYQAYRRIALADTPSLKRSKNTYQGEFFQGQSYAKIQKRCNTELTDKLAAAITHIRTEQTRQAQEKNYLSEHQQKQHALAKQQADIALKSCQVYVKNKPSSGIDAQQLYDDFYLYRQASQQAIQIDKYILQGKAKGLARGKQQNLSFSQWFEYCTHIFAQHQGELDQRVKAEYEAVQAKAEADAQAASEAKAKADTQAANEAKAKADAQAANEAKAKADAQAANEAKAEAQADTDIADNEAVTTPPDSDMTESDTSPAKEAMATAPTPAPATPEETPAKKRMGLASLLSSRNKREKPDTSENEAETEETEDSDALEDEDLIDDEAIDAEEELSDDVEETLLEEADDSAEFNEDVDTEEAVTKAGSQIVVEEIIEEDSDDVPEEMIENDDDDVVVEEVTETEDYDTEEIGFDTLLSEAKADRLEILEEEAMEPSFWSEDNEDVLQAKTWYYDEEEACRMYQFKQDKLLNKKILQTTCPEI